MNVNDDALDRLIQSLPLEEPPAGLRSSILMATAYRPAPIFSIFELAVIGAVGAVAVWMVAVLVLGGGSLFVHALSTIASGATQTLSNGATVAWLAAGSATALWLSLFTGSQPLVAVAQRSGRRAAR